LEEFKEFEEFEEFKEEKEPGFKSREPGGWGQGNG
jgi:hypothetical protein